MTLFYLFYVEQTMRIYPIINLKPSEIVDVNLLKDIFQVNPDYIQLRIKDGVYRDFEDNFEIISKTKETSMADTRIFINDMPDFAEKLGACGVHIGYEDARPDYLRKNYPNLAIGWSTHTLDQILEANILPVEYIGFGPCFKTNSKNTLWPEVFDLVNKAVTISQNPIVFIGGITTENYEQLPISDKNYFAVISALPQFLRGE